MYIKGKWNKNIYNTISLIGNGNFGKVYIGQNSKGNIVAIKISKELLSLNNEYNALKKFQNMPFVPNVYDFDDWEDNKNIQHFIVMDYIDGKNLKEIGQCKTLSNRNIFKIGLILLNILEKIDNLGYKYTDIKLGNILLDKKGHIYLIDYGSLVEKDKPTKEYTQSYNINCWNIKYKYSYEKSILFSITMIMTSLLGKKEFNPLLYDLEQVINKIQQFPINKEEKIFLAKGLKGKFNTFLQYDNSLRELLNKEKYNHSLSKIDYMLIASIVSFVFIIFIAIKKYF